MECYNIFMSKKFSKKLINDIKKALEDVKHGRLYSEEEVKKILFAKKK